MNIWIRGDNMLLYLLIFTVSYYVNGGVNGNFVPSHKAILKKGTYYLYWQYTDDSITFEAQVKTTGYVGFGISPNGGMTNSDIVIGWVKDGKNYFKDRFAMGKSLPAIDQSQDWTLLNAVQNGTWTSLRFTRKLKACDKLDLDITEDTMRVIWSYHNEDPTSETDIPHHTDRGVKSLQLLSFGPGLNPPAMPDDAFHLDFLQPNISVPSKETTYWCTTFKVEKLPQKHHVIKFDAIIQPDNEYLVHHIVLYGCYHEVDVNLVGTQAECWGPNMPEDLQCTSIMFAWGVGGGEFYLPENVGYPFGHATGPDLVNLEVHYNNQELRSGIVDTSGIRLTMTKVTRKYDAQLLTNGFTSGDDGQVIPPGVTNFKMVGSCPGECTEQAMVNHPSGINIISSMLHSHLLGRKIMVRHIRKGVELPLISDDSQYDFNYQETRVLKKEITVLPGDELRVECTYDSTDRTNVTIGGLGTREEMCESFLMYYPAINLTTCSTTSYPSQLAGIAGVHVPVENNQGGIYDKINGQNEFPNMTIYDILNNKVDWTNETIVREFERLSITTERKEVTCRMAKIKHPFNKKRDYFLPPITKPLLPPGDTVCVSGSTAIKHNILLLVAILYITW